MGDRNYTFDKTMELADGAAAQTADGYAQAGGADGIVDFGGNQAAVVTLPSIADVVSMTPQQARIDAVLMIILSARDIADSNELYRFTLVGSNDPAFGAGNNVCLAQMEFGFSTAQSFPNGKSVPAVPAVGGLVLEILFTNEQFNVKYQYAKLYLDVTGTTPSATYKAFVGVLPEP